MGGSTHPTRSLTSACSGLPHSPRVLHSESWSRQQVTERSYAASLGATTSNCSEITCVEVVPGEASECRQHIASARIPGSVIADSYFNWVLDAGPQAFTAVVGNPPYVRYQFVPPEDRQAAEQGLSRYGMDLAGVSNLWIPFLLLSLSQLAPGGVFALVLPHELLATVSAAQVRQFLVRQFKGIRVDLFPRTTFPDILQDVLVVSGQRRSRAASSAQVRFAEHGPNGTETWRHRVPASGDSWTRYLLAHDQVQAFGAGQALAGFRRLGDIARLQVAVITGANSFFTVSSAVLGEYSLQDFARPLLARTEDSPGLVFTPADHAAAQAAGKRTWLLDFVENGIEPETHPGVARYLQQGMIDGLHTRYKCRNQETVVRSAAHSVRQSDDVQAVASASSAPP